jgi:oligoribonuclease NrnB/cAMP/cGMP phosphodiesterase (DHH superfamily)
MGKTINNRRYFQDLEEDYDVWDTDREGNRRKRKEKRIDRALRTKNIQELVDLDEELD